MATIRRVTGALFAHHRGSLPWLLGSVLMLAWGGLPSCLHSGGGDGATQVCTPGTTANCPCVDSSESGKVTCAADGSGWLACEGCVSGPADVAFEPDVAAPDKDYVVGDDQASGKDVYPGKDLNGGKDWYVDKDLSGGKDQHVTPDTTPDLPSYLPGRCALTGEACDPSVGCASPTAPVYGRCIALPGNYSFMCLYSGISGDMFNVSCNEITVPRCTSKAECPSGLTCASFDVVWCVQGMVHGLCSATPPSGSCMTDAECDRVGLNSCVQCGDGVRDPDYEQCDDGNTSEADFCSNSCTSLGHCVDVSGVEEFVGSEYMPCAADSDCVNCDMYGVVCACSL